MDNPPTVSLDSRALHALAHPLRARILGMLRLDGPATATRLAARLGTTSGTTSYHLRKLAAAGLVAEDAAAGDGRDRWWRAAHQVTSWSQAQFRDDPDDRAAANWLIGYHLRANTRRTQEWLDAQDEWPLAWLEAADISDYRLHLTAAGAAALNADLHAVICRHRELALAAAGGQNQDADAVPAGATPGAAGPPDPETPVPVWVMLHLHPDAMAAAGIPDDV